MKNYKKAPLQAMTETEYFSKLNATNQQFLVAIIFVTVVMSIGGIFGVMNTMFAAIAQRTRDIGVLRLMGFARWQILASFFIESMAIAVIGGLVVSTALSLIFVPAVFTLLDDLGGLAWRLFSRLINSSEDRDATAAESATQAKPAH